MVSLLAALAVAAAVCVWPGRGSHLRARATVRRASAAGSWTSGLRDRVRTWRMRHATEPTSGTDGLAAFLDVMAPSLRAGRSPQEAVELACGVVEDPLADRLRAAARSGVPLEPVLAEAGRHDEAVRFFAQAWRMSAATGCPLAAATQVASRGVRARLDHRRHVETASAGTSATIRILTVLPLSGPLLAVAVGVDPVEAYLASPTAWGALIVGALLVAVGHRWVSTSVDRAMRGPVLGPEAGRASAAPTQTGGHR